MDANTQARLWGVSDALAHPAVRGILIALGAAVLLTPMLLAALSVTGKLSEKLKKDLWDRYRSWLIFIPMMVGPVLAGAGWVILGVGALALFCYREFARATGADKHTITHTGVIVGILAMTFATADHWYGLFVALISLTIAVIATTAILNDKPEGYIQRVALAVFAFLLFGVCYGHMGYLANDSHFRPFILWLIFCVELNDMFAYITGKRFGKRKLAPNTSPNKTIAGSLGALVLTTALAATLGKVVFQGTVIAQWQHLIVLGALLSITGQLGDLTLSSIKRDLGIKDWANTFPGHGGLLDRFNSLIFAAPVMFHYVGYFLGVGLDQKTRIMTGS